MDNKPGKFEYVKLRSVRWRGRAMGAEALESYLGGRWSRGHGAEINLVDPTNGSVLATVSAPGRPAR